MKSNGMLSCCMAVFYTNSLILQFFCVELYSFDRLSNFITQFLLEDNIIFNFVILFCSFMYVQYLLPDTNILKVY